MQEFNTTGLVTGFIKQLLATFELPTMRVYTEEFSKYFETYAEESPYIIESFNKLNLDKDGKLLNSTNIPAISKDEYNVLANSKSRQVDEDLLIPYLKDGRIQFLLGGYYTSDNTFVPGKWQSKDLGVDKPQGGLWETYNRGAAYLNLTKRLQIRNNIYDSYTHEYLGNYLRFLRDYDGLDLMSLYNCFSNRLCSTTTGLNIKLKDQSHYGQFDALDPNYKIYLIPVKLFKNYTIAIDSAMPVEICCGIYNNKLNVLRDEEKQLLTLTYCRKSNTRFNQPFLYTALTDLAPKKLSAFPLSEDINQHSAARKFIAKIASRESNMVMLLKVHKDVTSSIIILEGDYCKWNDFSTSFKSNTASSSYFDRPEKKVHLLHNHTVISNEAIYSNSPIPLIAPLQLLQRNTGRQMPFADRLVEYLLDMCITGSQDEPRENVLMAQYITGLHYNGSNMPTQYYIANRVGSTSDKILIFSDRQFCVNAGEYYIRQETEDGKLEQVLYKYNKDCTDDRLGHFAKWLSENQYIVNSDCYVSSSIPLDQNLQSGIWHPSLRRLFYRYMFNNTDHSLSAHSDILGYVDKDVEKNFVALLKDKRTHKSIKKTMLNFNIWEDIEE